VWSLTAGDDGTRTVYVQYQDRAGWNSSVKDDSIILDQTRPLLSISLPTNGSEVKSSSVQVEWSGSDALSDIDHYEVKIDDGSWLSVEKETTHTFPDRTEGSHTVWVKAVDKARNSRVSSVSFVVNLSPLGGPGYVEEAALIVVVVAVVLGVAVYFVKFRKKT